MIKPEDKTILVVDDEPDVLVYLKMALEDAGFNVVTASDGVQALERINERRPDFISLDLVMPKKSGIKFLHELRKKKEWATIPVMIVTAHAKDDFGSKDLKDILDGKILSGPEAYLEKPVKAMDYVNIIRRKLGIEIPEDEMNVNTAEPMRQKATDLLSEADPNTLEKILDILKSGN
ncbi:response regulator [Acidobacteriota bacterium]